MSLPLHTKKPATFQQQSVFSNPELLDESSHSGGFSCPCSGRVSASQDDSCIRVCPGCLGRSPHSGHQTFSGAPIGAQGQSCRTQLKLIFIWHILGIFHCYLLKGCFYLLLLREWRKWQRWFWSNILLYRIIFFQIKISLP